MRSKLKVTGPPRLVTVINKESGERRRSRVCEDGIVRDGTETFDRSRWTLSAVDILE
jgi:hypothetical protein